MIQVNRPPGCQTLAITRTDSGMGWAVVLTAKPPKILSRDAPGCGKCRGVRFSTCYAMTVPERVETRNFVRYGSAMTAALHLGFPILRRLSDEANGAERTAR